MDERTITVPRSARFFVEGERPFTGTDAWFVLHGYGERADAFLERCAVLSGPGRLLVAPEALSRFYLRRGTGEVGASWMTKVAREQEIADYVRYLDAVYGEALGTLAPRARVHVLGFSQGAATAMRWAARGLARVDRLILWGGGVPPELDLEEHRSRLERLELAFVVGLEDEAHPRAALEADAARLRSARLPVRVVRFEGGHALDAPTLEALAAS